MSKPPGLNSDQLNYLIWRYLQESGYGQAAVILQRDWNLDPQSLPFTKHVKGRALIRLAQRGLEHYYLEKQVVEGVERDQLQPSMFYFGPESAQSRTSQPQYPDVSKETTPSLSNVEPSSKSVIGPGSARKHAREPIQNGNVSEVLGQPAPKKSRKSATNGFDRNGEQPTNHGDEIAGPNTMDVDKPTGYNASTAATGTPASIAKSPTPAFAKSDGDVDADTEMEMGVGAGLSENGGGTAANAAGAGNLDAPADSEQEPSKLVMPDAAEPPIITHTLTNGHSVGVQIMPAKAADLEAETTILTVADAEHVTKALWRPKDATVLAAAGYNFCGIWKIDKENTEPGPIYPLPPYYSLLDKSDNAMISAVAWEPGGAMLAIATYTEQAGQLRIYDGHDAVLVENVPAAKKMITSLKWQNVGSRLVGFATAGGQDSCLVLWDLHSANIPGNGLLSVTVPEELNDVDWASHGNISVVCAAGKGVIYQFRAATDFAVEHRWPSNDDEDWNFVRCSWWSEESSIVIAAANDTATLWLPTKDITRRNVHLAPITNLELRPTSIVHSDQTAHYDFATSSLDGTIKIWRFDSQLHNLTQLFKVSMISGIENPVLACSFSPDGSYIGAASFDKLNIWSTETGGPAIAKWESGNNPASIAWKGAEIRDRNNRKKQLQEQQKDTPETNGNETNDNPSREEDEIDEPDPYSISWDADSRRLALGLGTQVAIVNFHG